MAILNMVDKCAVREPLWPRVDSIAGVLAAVLEGEHNGKAYVYMGQPITRDTAMRAYRLRHSRPNYLAEWARFKSKS